MVATDDLVENGEENLRHFAERLVAQATEDEQARLVSFQDSANGSAQRPGACGIMRDIEDPFRFSWSMAFWSMRAVLFKRAIF